MGYTYMNPASSTTWFDEFVQVIDEAYDHKVIILLLVDFNIDLCKQRSTCENITSLFNFHGLAQSTTIMKSTTAVLNDETYTNN